jgi:hypothetical protein
MNKELKQGVELDCLVAKEVMGCPVEVDECGEWITYPPAYSTDPKYIDDIKEKLFKDGFDWFDICNIFSAIVQTKTSNGAYAICLTALRMKAGGMIKIND